MRTDDLPSFHDAGLLGFEIGPRRELRLTLSPAGETSRDVTLRLGAIDDLEHVRRFFEALPGRPAEDAFLDRVEALEVVAGVPGRGVVRLALRLDHAGSVEIVCSKVDLEPPAAD